MMTLYVLKSKDYDSLYLSKDYGLVDIDNADVFLETEMTDQKYTTFAEENGCEFVVFESTTLDSEF